MARRLHSISVQSAPVAAEGDLEPPSQLPAPSRTNGSGLNRNVTNHASPALTVGEMPHKRGYGVFAARPIAKGEVLVIWGGRLVPADQFNALSERDRSFGFQVDDAMFLVTLDAAHDVADYVNHSCAPNAGLSGQISLVAMRDIPEGEEICFDYAMTDSSPLLEFDCRCGAPGCRGRIRGDDWRNPALRRRYRGYFSAYLQRRIEAEREAQRAVRVVAIRPVASPSRGGAEESQPGLFAAPPRD